MYIDEVRTISATRKREKKRGKASEREKKRIKEKIQRERSGEGDYS